jgi:large subunit ribosomal protein L29
VKSADLRLKNVAELNDELSALLKAYFNLRIQKATQQLQNTSLFKKYRRDIARVRTVLSEKGGSK